MAKKAEKQTSKPDQEQAARPIEWQHPTGRIPESVDLVALGPSSRTYHAMHGGQYTPPVCRAREVWAVNKGTRTIRHDVAFVLDDLVGECDRSAVYREHLDGLGAPIITSILDDEVARRLPNASRAELISTYPLWAIIDDVGERIARARGIVNFRGKEHRDAVIRELGMGNAFYMRNSIPMILAYALFIGVREVRMWGVDYDFPGMPHIEAEKANCEYWVAMLRAFGVRVLINSDSTLCHANRAPWVYGYGARQPYYAN